MDRAVVAVVVAKEEPCFDRGVYLSQQLLPVRGFLFQRRQGSDAIIFSTLASFGAGASATGAETSATGAGTSATGAGTSVETAAWELALGTEPGVPGTLSPSLSAPLTAAYSLRPSKTPTTLHELASLKVTLRTRVPRKDRPQAMSMT